MNKFFFLHSQEIDGDSFWLSIVGQGWQAALVCGEENSFAPWSSLANRSEKRFIVAELLCSTTLECWFLCQGTVIRSSTRLVVVPSKFRQTFGQGSRLRTIASQRLLCFIIYFQTKTILLKLSSVVMLQEVNPIQGHDHNFDVLLHMRLTSWFMLHT